MRILVVAPGPSFSVADVQNGLTRALQRLGHDVRTYNLDDRLAFFASARWHGDQALEHEQVMRLSVEPLGNACYRFWPDLIIVISGFFVPLDVWNIWKQRPHRTVMFCTESPYEDDVQFERIGHGEPDLVLLNDPINIERYRSWFPNVHYMPHAHDPEIHSPGPPVAGLGCDFAFVGTAYQSRLDLLARVDWRDISLKLGGFWQNAEGTCFESHVVHPIGECLDNADTVQLYRSCKASANMYRAGRHDDEAHLPELAQGWAMGPREIELAACETFFLREPRPEGDELLSMLPTFTEPGDFAEQLRWWLAHEDARNRVAQEAHAAVRDRTFDVNARRLLQLLDNT